MKKGWEIKTLSDLADIKGGKRVPKGYRLETEPTNHPYIRVTDFNDNGTVELSDIHYISDSVFEQIKNYTISTKDLYISIAGTIGKTGIIPNELEGANLTENACKLVFKTEVDPKFVYYFTQTDDFIQQAGLNTRVAAMPKLALSRLSTISFLFPNYLPEQQRIVQLLDEAFEKIDTLKANAERNLQNAKELFQSALTEELKPKEGWEEKTIEKTANIINGYAFPSNDFKPTNSIKSIKITNVGVNEFVEETDNYLPDVYKDTLPNIQIKKGSIVIALTRTIISAGLKVAVVPASYDGALINQRVAALNSKEEILNQRFLYYYFTTKAVSNYVLAHVNTLMQPNLSINDLKSMPIPCPSLTEQQTIVEHLDALSARCITLENNYQKTIAQCAEMKKAVLVKAFNGEL